MTNFIKRLFKTLQANINSGIDKIEDPIILIEQGIRDLKKDLKVSIKNLAEGKSGLILLKRKLEEQQKSAEGYEQKAIQLIKKAEANELSQDKADELASAALVKKNQASSSIEKFIQEVEHQEKMVLHLEQKIKTLKSQIMNWQNELVSLKSRAKLASSTKKINEQLATVNSDSTVAMLENMKAKVDRDEAMAQAYEELTGLEDTVDDQINHALEEKSVPSITDSLAELKNKIKNNN